MQGISHVCCYIDEILVTGVNKHEHLQNLEEILHHLEQNNLQIKKLKCEFFKDFVEYLGHSVDVQGLHTLHFKLKAILKAPDLENLQQLKSFLGLLIYYGKFIPTLASITAGMLPDHPSSSILCMLEHISQTANQLAIYTRKLWRLTTLILLFLGQFFTYLLAQEGTKYETFEAHLQLYWYYKSRISNTSS